MNQSYTINENLAVIEMGIQNLSLNKPICIVFLVLEISKLWMYMFHYDKMLNWFSNISLKFTDTDTLLYTIQDLDVSAEMKEHEDEFDFSEYPLDHPRYDPMN